MILTDTGPIVALLDKGQVDIHRKCVESYKQMNGPLLTTAPCFTESMYLLAEPGGWPAQKKLWQLWKIEAVVLHGANRSDYKRMAVLMDKYRDIPMDFADASLVVAAEKLRINRIFTIDSDFYIYRINGSEAFTVAP